MPPLAKTYIQHYDVHHPSKPGRICVVCDCSGEYERKSVNQELLSGPDLTNQVGGVLTHFRQKPVAFMADVEFWYYQALVPDNQQVFLKFLSCNDGNLLKEPQNFVMCAHVFGETSYASCSNCKRTAEENESLFGKAVSEVLQKVFM